MIGERAIGSYRIEVGANLGKDVNRISGRHGDTQTVADPLCERRSTGSVQRRCLRCVTWHNISLENSVCRVACCISAREMSDSCVSGKLAGGCNAQSRKIDECTDLRGTQPDPLTTQNAYGTCLKLTHSLCMCQVGLTEVRRLGQRDLLKFETSGL